MISSRYGLPVLILTIQLRARPGHNVVIANRKLPSHKVGTRAARGGGELALAWSATAMLGEATIVYRIINAVDESGERHQVHVHETQQRVLAGLQTIPTYSLIRTSEPLHFEHGLMVGDETGIRLRVVE